MKTLDNVSMSRLRSMVARKREKWFGHRHDREPRVLKWTRAMHVSVTVPLMWEKAVLLSDYLLAFGIISYHWPGSREDGIRLSYYFGA
jgi:hypothetical protein